MSPWSRCIVVFAILTSAACGVQHKAAEHPAQARAHEARELYQSGIELARQGDLTRAEQYLVSALRSGYDEREATRALLVVCVRSARLRSALSYASPYLAAHPRDLRLRQLVASLRFALGDLAAVKSELARVIALDPAQPEAHYLLALVLEREGQDEPAMRASFARYLELSPEGIHAEEARDALQQAQAPVPERIGS